jgi:hypothetical protein
LGLFLKEMKELFGVEKIGEWLVKEVKGHDICYIIKRLVCWLWNKTKEETQNRVKKKTTTGNKGMRMSSLDK